MQTLLNEQEGNREEDERASASKRARIFRDDTAQMQAVGKGLLSRHNSEPDVQSFHPRKKASDEKNGHQSDQILENLSCSMTGGHKTGFGDKNVIAGGSDDDQVSLSTPTPVPQLTPEEVVRTNDTSVRSSANHRATWPRAPLQVSMRHPEKKPQTPETRPSLGEADEFQMYSMSDQVPDMHVVHTCHPDMYQSSGNGSYDSVPVETPYVQGTTTYVNSPQGQLSMHRSPYMQQQPPMCNHTGCNHVHRSDEFARSRPVGPFNNGALPMFSQNRSHLSVGQFNGVPGTTPTTGFPRQISGNFNHRLYSQNRNSMMNQQGAGIPVAPKPFSMRSFLPAHGNPMTTMNARLMSDKLRRPINPGFGVNDNTSPFLYGNFPMAQNMTKSTTTIQSGKPVPLHRNVSTNNPPMTAHQHMPVFAAGHLGPKAIPAHTENISGAGGTQDLDSMHQDGAGLNDINLSSQELDAILASFDTGDLENWKT